MSEKNKALAGVLGGIFANCLDVAEDKQAEEKAYRACVMQMLMRIAVALETIAAGTAAARADVHTAASEDAASLAGHSVTEAPKAAAAQGTENPANVVTARLTETPAAEPAAKPEPAPAAQKPEQPTVVTAQVEEKPAVVTARVEEQKAKAKELEPRLMAQMKISDAYKGASAEKRATPLGTYIRNACATHGWKSFGTVPDEGLDVLVSEVLLELEA